MVVINLKEGIDHLNEVIVKIKFTRKKIQRFGY